MPLQKVSKEEIILKAIEVFGQSGYHYTSIHDLAQACGLLKGSVYHYFKSKDEILLAAIQYARNFYREKIFSCAYRQPELSPYQCLEKLLTKQHQVFTRNRRGCFFANLVIETSIVTEKFREELIYFFRDWRMALQHIFMSSGMNPEFANQVAERTIAEIEGAVMLYKLTGEETYLLNARNHALAYLKNE